MQLRPLLVLASLLFVGLAPAVSGEGFPEAPPLQFSAANERPGAAWFSLDELQGTMEFRLLVNAEEEYEMGAVLVGEGGAWRYEMTGSSSEVGARAALRVNGARTLDHDGARPFSQGTTLASYRGCPGWTWLGGGSGPGVRQHSFGFAHDAGCEPGDGGDLLVWVAAKRPASWTVEIAAPEPVTLTQVEAPAAAVYATASDFDARNRAFATSATLDASAGEAAVLRLEATRGLRASFGPDEWDAVASVGGSASRGDAPRACPCEIRAGEAGEWTFRLEEATASVGGRFVLVALDTSFPW